MSDEPNFAGKVALVTGGASGIGAAIARHLGRSGAAVVVADRDLEGAVQVAGELARAIPLRLDVADPDEVRKAVETCVAQFGALHLAVNNAGISGSLAVTAAYPIEEWRRVLGVNLDGVFYGLRFQIPAILAAGGGAIVNMASIYGAVGASHSPAYVAAKHGVVGLTRAAALEYSGLGVRVNAIGPAFIETPMFNNTPSLDRQAILALHPIGRFGRPEDVAELAAFLLSDRAGFMTGGYYPIDGGYLAQ